MLCNNININFINMQVVPAAGVDSSYTNVLTIVVLKIHIYNFIVRVSK